jgi:hypothetical protein
MLLARREWYLGCLNNHLQPLEIKGQVDEILGGQLKNAIQWRTDVPCESYSQETWQGFVENFAFQAHSAGCHDRRQGGTMVARCLDSQAPTSRFICLDLLPELIGPVMIMEANKFPRHGVGREVDYAPDNITSRILLSMFHNFLQTITRYKFKPRAAHCSLYRNLCAQLTSYGGLRNNPDHQYTQRQPVLQMLQETKPVHPKYLVNQAVKSYHLP